MTAARTLSDALRALDHDQLAELLRLRPDLRYPLPRQISDLVGQATTSTSVARAMDGLDAWQAAAAEALAVLGDGATAAGIADLLATSTPAVVPAVEALRRRALLWGDDDDLHPVRALRDHFGSYPAGLAPPSPHPLTDSRISAALEACGEQVEPVVDRLVWGPPTGTVRNADRTIRVAEARSPVELLLAHRLLRPRDRDTVVLAREVALHLRRRRSDWLLGGDRVADRPPELSGPVRNLSVVRSAAVGAANELVHDLDVIITEIDARPPRLLRDGGLAARDITQLSRVVDDRADYTGFLVELGTAAGLIRSPDGVNVIPTVDHDRWTGRPGAERWLDLARAWRDADRYLHLTTDARPLGPDRAAPRAPELRRLVLQLTAALPPGTVLDVDELAAAVGWHRPAVARSGRAGLIIGWIRQEAGWLGLLALDAVSALVAPVAGDRELPAELARLFPEPLDHVIIQSDLTAVAPGPLEASVAGTLRLLADQESRGGGAVYRFSPSSVRRAFDAGWAAVDIDDWLQRHSRTGVPQPLRYLVDDVARQHGSIRVGAASSYLRIEDPAQQAAILAGPDAARLQLRPIAPGVLVSAADAHEVVAVLQRLGLKPAAEDDQGRVLTTGPRRRAPGRADRSRRPSVPSPDEAASAILAAESRLPAPPRTDGIELLAAAARAGRTVTVDYVDADGARSRRTITPVRLGDGRLHAVDPQSGRTVSLAVSRIADVIGD